MREVILTEVDTVGQEQCYPTFKKQFDENRTFRKKTEFQK